MTVMLHPSSSFLGVPVAAYGVAAYATIAAMLAIQLGCGRNKLLDTVAYSLALIGTITSLGLTIYAAAAIGGVCSWCLASTVIMCLLLASIARYHSLLAGQGFESAEPPAGSRALALMAPTLLATALVFWRVVTLPSWDDMGVDQQVLRSLPLEELVPADARRLGPPEAEFTLVVFSDFGCSACHYYLPKLIDIANSSERLAIVLRHLPLKMDSAAYQAAVTAESSCTDSEFWSFVGVASLRNARKWTEFRRAFASAGMVSARLHMRPSSRERVLRDRALAKRLRVPGTPWFILVGPGDSFRREVGLEQLVEHLGRAETGAPTSGRNVASVRVTTL